MLAGINGVADVGNIGVIRVGSVDRHKAGNVGNSVVPNAEQAKPVLAEMKDTSGIELILFGPSNPVRKSLERASSTSGFEITPAKEELSLHAS